MSGSNLSEGNWCGESIFSNTKKLKNSNIKSKKVTKTYWWGTKENKAKQKTTKSVLHAEKHRMCTQKIRKNAHKK